MSQINRTGTFRFQPIDAGITLTKNGYPQWVAQLQANEYYDEETEQWIDWTQYDEREISCYMVLFGSDGKPLLNAVQLQKALGWSGASFEELEYEHIADIKFQGRVEEHTYEGTTNLRVNWIDAYDAEPGRTLQKLDTVEVKKLSAKFISQLRTLSGGTKPKSVPEKPNKEDVKTVKKEQLEEQKARSQAAKAKTPPRPPSLKKPTTELKEPEEKMDKGTAWLECYKNRDKSVTDQQLTDAWHEIVDNLGGEDEIEKKGQWAEVTANVIKKWETYPSKNYHVDHNNNL